MFLSDYLSRYFDKKSTENEDQALTEIICSLNISEQLNKFQMRLKFITNSGTIYF